MPEKKSAKSNVVAFKVEEELASFLNQLPNKSDFIRRAIYSQLDVSCPLCTGTGKVTKETHDQFARFLDNWHFHEWSDGAEFPVPNNPSDMSDDLREHLRDTLAKGRAFCYTCHSCDEADADERSGSATEPNVDAGAEK